MADKKQRGNPNWVKGGPSPNPDGAKLHKTDSAEKPQQKQARRDGWINFFTGHGVMGRDKRQGSSFQSATLTFDQLAELWRGDDLAARCVETLPKEALRQGYDLIIPESEDDGSTGDEADRIAEVLDKLDKLGADQVIRTALGYERGIGGGAVLIGANDGQTDLTKPLNLDAVRSIDWLTPLEAREIYPVYGYADPRAPKYGQPEIYRLVSRAILPPAGGTYAEMVMDIHESRLLIFPGVKISRYQATASQGGWGDSVLIRMWRVLRDFNLAWGSTGVLISEFSPAVYKMKDLWEMMASDDGPNAFAQRLQAMDLAKSTINATVIDADDDYERSTTPITGLADLLDKFATRLAAAADMPLTLLFGTSPAGLSATGESDIRFFYDRVAAYQRDKILPQLMRIIQIIFRTTGQKQEPEKWSIRFKPLWQESAADRAKAQLTIAQADVAWIGAQVYAPEEAADSHWGSGEWNPEISIDFDARAKQEQATDGPVSAQDYDAMGRPIPPGYEPPPGGAGGTAPPDPNTPPQSIVQNDRTDDFNEALHPREANGRWGNGSGGVVANTTKGYNAIGEMRHGIVYKNPQKGTHIVKAQAYKTQKNAEKALDLLAQKHKEMPDLHLPPESATARSLIAYANESEKAGHGAGFTYNPVEGKFRAEGYAVSTHPGHEVLIKGHDITEEQLTKYVHNPERQQVFKDDKQACIGGWYDPNKDEWNLDVSHVEHDRVTAVKFAQQFNQRGIYDLKRGETINEPEYKEAIAGTGRFTGRADARNDQNRNGPSDDDPKRNVRRDERDTERGEEEAGDRVDYSPDQPRDPDGKFGSGNGTAKGPNSAWLAANKEALAKYKEVGGHAGNHEKAKAGMRAGEREYEEQVAKNGRIGTLSRANPMVSSMPREEYEKRMLAAGERAAAEEHASNQRVRLDPRSYVTGGTMRGEDPSAIRTAPGQQKISGLSLKTEEKELHQRIQENLKNNAKHGESALPESQVVANVKNVIAKEKEAKAEGERIRAEKDAKNAVAKQEREAKAAEANDRLIKAEAEHKGADNAYRAAQKEVDKVVAQGKGNGNADPKLKAEFEEALAKEDKAKELRDDLNEKRQAAQKEYDKLANPSVERSSTPESISELSSRDITKTKNLGGGMMESTVATLDDGSKAVYKPASGERTARSNVASGTYYLREAAASKCASVLGCQDLVPATVITDGPQGRGSLQAFVPDSTNLSEAGHEVMFDRDGAERMRMFDYITGGSDRHSSNVMVVETKDGRTMPGLIDNGLSFPGKVGDHAARSNPKRFIQPWDAVPEQPLSGKTENLINRLDHVKLASVLAESGINEEAVRGVIGRAEHLKHTPEILDVDGENKWDESHWNERARVGLKRYARHINEVMNHPDVKASFQRGSSLLNEARAGKNYGGDMGGDGKSNLSSW